MINAIQQKAVKAGDSMESGVARVDAGVRLASQAGSELQEMRRVVVIEQQESLP